MSSLSGAASQERRPDPRHRAALAGEFGSLDAAHTLNVAHTSPAQEFRFSFPLYLMALLSLPLALAGRRGP